MSTVTAGMATKLTATTTDSSGTTMSHDQQTEPHTGQHTSQADAPLHGLLAEYETPWALVDASKKVRDAGFSRWGQYVVAVNAAVPEPATWAMMIAGFGMVGFAARRSSRTTVRVTMA